jgi:hypothetical protein
MLIFLACLFLIAVASGSYVAFSIAETILGSENAPRTRV